MTRLKKDLAKGNLIRRYLIWCYKTTKEDLDRIDRYFTQYEVDTFLLRELRAVKESSLSSADAETYTALVNEFDRYKEEKHQKALLSKFTDSNKAQPTPAYQYLRNRVAAIEKAIVHFLGKEELIQIQGMYEKEMIARILAAREHS